MFLTEIVDLSNVFTFSKKKNDVLNIWSYKFKTDEGFNFSVDFIYDEDEDSWGIHFQTKERMFDELDTKERFKILNTIAKITLDFIEIVKPKKIEIYHLRSRKEFYSPNDENKRLNINKYFLSKVLPKNYKINTFGNESEISLVENKQPLNEIAELTNTYSYEKISSDGDKVKYRFSDGEDIFFVKFQLLSIGKFGEEYERKYYTTNRWMDELNKGNILRIIGTVTKITLDFINDYKPGQIDISHIDSKKEISGRFSIDAILSGNKTKNSGENKRAKINRLFLSKNLPNDYSMEFISNITKIKRKDLNEGLQDKLKSRAPEQEKESIKFYSDKILNGEYDGYISDNIFAKLPEEIKLKYINNIIDKIEDGFSVVLSDKIFDLLSDEIKLKYINNKIDRFTKLTDKESDWILNLILKRDNRIDWLPDLPQPIYTKQIPVMLDFISDFGINSFKSYWRGRNNQNINDKIKNKIPLTDKEFNILPDYRKLEYIYDKIENKIPLTDREFDWTPKEEEMINRLTNQ